MSFIRSKKGLHHFMMRPVFLFVLLFGFIASANAKTLIFQSQAEASPEQLVASNLNATGSTSVSAAKVYKTQRQTASANSELFFMLEQLQQEVRYLRGMLEEQSNQIHRLKLNGKNRYRDIDSRVLDLSKKLSDVSSVGSVSAIGSSLSAPVVPVVSVGEVKAVATTESKASQTSSSLPSEAQKREYQQAYSLIKDKNFKYKIRKIKILN